MSWVQPLSLSYDIWKSSTVILSKKMKVSEVKKLKILNEALGTGQVIRIKYHGGINPGMVRDITPVYFNNKRPHLIDCYCTAAQDIRSFNIDKIEILEANVQTDAHVPHIVSFPNMSSTTSNGDLKQIIETKGLLHGTKYYKNITGVSLSEAKKYVDEFISKNNIKPSKNGGCAGVILLFVLLAALSFLV